MGKPEQVGVSFYPELLVDVFPVGVNGQFGIEQAFSYLFTCQTEGKKPEYFNFPFCQGIEFFKVLFNESLIFHQAS